jgi:hypothetical protein
MSAETNKASSRELLKKWLLASKEDTKMDKIAEEDNEMRLKEEPRNARDDHIAMKVRLFY